MNKGFIKKSLVLTVAGLMLVGGFLVINGVQAGDNTFEPTIELKVGGDGISDGDTVDYGETIEVVWMVKNTGEEENTQEVEMSRDLAGNDNDWSKSVTLDSDASSEIDSENYSTEDNGIGQYTFGIETKNEAITKTVEVVVGEDTVYNVDKEEDYDKIQDAIDNAGEGDTIKVGPGTYEENVVVDVKNLTLESVKGFEETVIDGKQGMGIEIKDNLEEVVIQGFAVENWEIGGIGQGMGSREGTSPRIIENKIRDASPVAQHGNSIQVTGDESKVIDNIVDVSHLDSEDWSGTGILVFGASDVEVRGNIVRDGEDDRCIGIDGDDYETPVAKNNEVKDNEIKGCKVGLSVGEGASSTYVNENEFVNNKKQVVGSSEELDLQSIYEDNDFDRAVLVKGSDVKVPVIFSSIQDAVNEAKEGDTVLVGEGTYEENITIETERVTLYSEEEHGAVINGRIDIDANEVVVDRFKIAREGKERSGRGIVFSRDSATDGKVLNNHIEGFLTGLMHPQDGYIIEDNLFTDNTAGIGGWHEDGASVNNNDFIGNDHGIGIGSDTNTEKITIEGNQFEDNTLEGHVVSWGEEQGFLENTVRPTNEFEVEVHVVEEPPKGEVAIMDKTVLEKVEYWGECYEFGSEVEDKIAFVFSDKISFELDEIEIDKHGSYKDDYLYLYDHDYYEFEKVDDNKFIVKVKEGFGHPRNLLERGIVEKIEGIYGPFGNTVHVPEGGVEIEFDRIIDTDASEASFEDNKDGTGTLYLIVKDDCGNGIEGLKKEDFIIEWTHGPESEIREKLSEMDPGYWEKIEFEERGDGVYEAVMHRKLDKMDHYSEADIEVNEEVIGEIEMDMELGSTTLQSVEYEGMCNEFGSHMEDKLTFVFSRDVYNPEKEEIDIQPTDVHTHHRKDFEIEGNILTVTVNEEFNRPRDLSDPVTSVDGVYDSLSEEPVEVPEEGVEIEMKEVGGVGEVSDEKSSAEFINNEDGTADINVSIIDKCGDGIENLSPDEFVVESTSGNTFDFGHQRFNLENQENELYAFLYSPMEEVNYEWELSVDEVVIDIFEAVVSVEPETYTLTFEVGDGEGETSPEEGGYEHEEGSEIEIEAIPEDDYEFIEWTGDTEHIDDENSATTKVTMPAEDITLTANFDQIEATAIGGGGGIVFPQATTEEEEVEEEPEEEEDEVEGEVLGEEDEVEDEKEETEDREREGEVLGEADEVDTQVYLAEYGDLLASVNEEDYTQESWEEYQQVVEGNSVTEESPRGEIEGAIDAIATAQEEVLVPVDEEDVEIEEEPEEVEEEDDEEEDKTVLWIVLVLGLLGLGATLFQLFRSKE